MYYVTDLLGFLDKYDKRAFKNLKSYIEENPDDVFEDFCDEHLYVILQNLFTWDKSPQGWEYWNSLHNDLLEAEI